MIYSNILDTKISYLGMGFCQHEDNTDLMVDIAINNGMNYFEVATFYLNGECESIAGKSLSRYNRDLYKLCDKLCLSHYLEDDNFSLEFLNTFFEELLKKCRVDYFDVYLLLALDDKTYNFILNNKFILDFFNDKRERGIIKSFGFSFHSDLKTLKNIIALNNWDVVLIAINLKDWFDGVASLLYDYLVSIDMPIIAMGPAKGAQITKFLGTDYIKRFYQYFPNLSLYHMSILLLLSLPGIKIILTGSAKPNELVQNIRWVDQQLPFTERDKLIYLTLLARYKRTNFIPCTGCKYCEAVCPMNIPIAKIFDLINKSLTNDKDKEKYQLEVSNYLGNEGFKGCLHCNLCMQACTQHLNIQAYSFLLLYTRI